MIANAGALGLDWRTLDLSSYLEALEAHNEAHTDPKDKAPPEASERLKRFMAAHKGDGGNTKAATDVARER